MSPRAPAADRSASPSRFTGAARSNASFPSQRAALAFVAAGALASCSPTAKVDARPTYAATVLEDHPASYWRFGERVAAREAHDETGRAPAQITAGVRVGADGAIAGDGDTAYAFDGVSGAAVGPDVHAFEGVHAFTVEVWIRPAAGGAPIQRICNHRQGPLHTGWRLYVDATKRVVFERWTDDRVLGAAGAELRLDAYAHVVGRYDGATLELYVDGALRASAPDAHPIGAFAAPLAWGAASTNDQDFFLGSLDEGAVYDGALPPDRIARHHAVGVGSPSP